MGIITSALTFPLRRPVLTLFMAAGVAACSSSAFGPLATLQATTAVVGGITSAVSGVASGVSLIATAAKGVFVAGHKALVCPAVVEAVRTGGVTQQIAEKVAYCAGYFPSGVK
jgi:hypothetical protein